MKEHKILKIIHFFLGEKLSNKITEPYKGLSKEIWILALLTLINRAGAMVIPFLTLYLTDILDFSFKQVGWIMTFYAFGSVAGTWTGGKLTDKIGFHKLMYSSLFLTGVLFVGLQFLQTFWQFSFGVFLLIFVADTFRPAIYVAMDSYSHKDNKARSVTLIRLAINLGFPVGSVFGGFIIATLGYKLLFWIDGITTIVAAFIVYKFLVEKNIIKTKTEVIKANLPSAYKDKQYLIFWFAMFLGGFAFMQFVFTLPLYYRDIIHLDEQQIGYLIALNGILIFATEMPLVSYIIKKKYLHINLMVVGSILMALSFFALNVSHLIAVIVLSVVLITVGEMLSFPFSNTYAMERSKRGNKGEYMALYTMSFAIANIFAANLGLNIVAEYGFNVLWYICGSVLLLSIILYYWLKKDYLKSKIE